MTLLGCCRRLPLAAAIGWIACSSGSPATPSTAAPGPGTAGRFEVTFPGAGVTIGGVLFRPEIAAGRVPGLIVLHGWRPAGGNGAASVEGLARRYADEGYVALAPSMRGWPPSGGADDCGLRQPDDINAAVAWMANLPGVDPARIGIVGYSQGGQISLLAAARSPGLRAVAAYFPVTDVALWKATTAHPDIPTYVALVCEPGGVAPRSPVVHAGTITAPVLLVHGDADTRVPTEQSERMRAALEAAGRPVELFLVPGAAHGFTAAEEALARTVLDRFLAAHLGR